MPYLNQHKTVLKLRFILPVFLLAILNPGITVAQVAVSPDPLIITQPDNSTLTIIGKGTAQEPYTETIDGYTIIRNHKGYYVYAIPDKQQNLVPSKKKAHNPESRTKCERRIINKTLAPHLRNIKKP